MHIAQLNGNVAPHPGLGVTSKSVHWECSDVIFFKNKNSDNGVSCQLLHLWDQPKISLSKIQLACVLQAIASVLYHVTVGCMSSLWMHVLFMVAGPPYGCVSCGCVPLWLHVLLIVACPPYGCVFSLFFACHIVACSSYGCMSYVWLHILHMPAWPPYGCMSSVWLHVLLMGHCNQSQPELAVCDFLGNCMLSSFVACGHGKYLIGPVF